MAQVNHQVQANILVPVWEVGTTVLIAGESWHLAFEVIRQASEYLSGGVTFDMTQNFFTMGFGTRF